MSDTFLTVPSEESQLAADVRMDIERFIEGQNRLLFNEFDFQMQLCLFLRESEPESGKYDEVNAEYFMPTRRSDKDSSKPQNIHDGYEWDSNMRVDIVVRRGAEYLPVELKYTTRRVVGSLDRFGRIVENIEILRNQGAQDLVRYNCWKDVRRIELIKQIFPAVKAGLAVHLTCDDSYTRSPKESSACFPFDTSGSRPIGSGEMDWLGKPATAKGHQKFTLDGCYRMVWHRKEIQGIKFYYEILNI